MNVINRHLFHDEDVYMAGKFFIDCIFARCVIHGVPEYILGCTFFECDRSVRGHNCIGWGNTDGAVGRVEPDYAIDVPMRNKIRTIYDAKMRETINQNAKGKTIKSLEWTEADGGYWTMTFTDGSEISFRFMAELV